MENIKLKDFETIKDNHGKIKVVGNQMRSPRENITQKRHVEKIIVSFTEKCWHYNYCYKTVRKFSNFISSWTNRFFIKKWEKT